MEVTDAIISGRAGVAVLFDGESYFSFCVERPDDLRPRRPAEVRMLFGEADDLELLENISHGDAARALEAAFTRASALDLALITFDPSLSHELRDEAATELDVMLADEAVCDHLENVLYAHELPEGSDLGGALARGEAGRPRLLATLRGLREHQTAITGVRLAWEAIPAENFDDPAQRAELRRAAARAGLFRRLARADVNDADEVATELARSLPAVSPARGAGLARAWVGRLAELQKIVGRQEGVGLEEVATRQEADAHAAPAEVGRHGAPAADEEKVSAAAAQEAAPPTREAAPPPPEEVPQDGEIFYLADTARLVNVISTSLLSLDQATGLGGLPAGHAVEFYGPRNSGKTALAHHIASVAEAAGRASAFVVLAPPTPSSTFPFTVFAPRFPTQYVLTQGDALARAWEFIETGKANFVVVVNLWPTYSFFDPVTPQALSSLAALAASRDACLIYVTHTDPAHMSPPPNFLAGGPLVVEESTPPGFSASLRFRFSNLTAQELWTGTEIEVQVTKNTVGQVMGKVVLAFSPGEGFSPEADLLMLAEEHQLVQRHWGALRYGNTVLGIDRPEAVSRLRVDCPLRRRLEAEVLSAMGSRRGRKVWKLGRAIDGPRARRRPPIDPNLPLGLTFGEDPRPSRTDITLPDGNRQKH